MTGATICSDFGAPQSKVILLFIGRTDVEDETPVLRPHDAKSWLIGKDTDTGKDWGQKEKGMTEDEMVGWYHWLNGHGFGWIPGVGDGQGGLACCGSWGRKESNMTELPNWTKNNVCHYFHCFPIYLLWSDGTRWHDLGFLNVEF